MGLCYRWGSSRVVSVDVIRRINRIVIQNVSLGLLYTARRACVSIILVSGENYGKKVWDEYSLLQGREREMSFERKRSKRKKSLEGSNDKKTPLGEVISRFERSFLDFDSNARNWY